MIVLDGKRSAAAVADELRVRIKQLGRAPRLVIVRVGDDPRSTVYIQKKIAYGASLGVAVEAVELESGCTEMELRSMIRAASAREDVDGVIVQSPIAAGMDFLDLVDEIDPVKDVDGLCSKNLRRALDRARVGKGRGAAFRAPATALGIERLLLDNDIKLSGARVLIVGRSLIAGLSAGLSMLAHDATITVAHAASGDLKSLCDNADIVVLAAGKPGLYGVELARPHHVVVDVGITALTGGKIVGDADFAAVAPCVRAISPVPGGVGPMTVASLFRNVVDAAFERDALLH